MTTSNYDELAERAERGELSVKPGTVRRGSAAADEARRALLEAAGASTVDELTHIALGRPSISAKQGASPVVRARVPQALKNTIVALAESDNRKESDLVREALAAYVKTRVAS
ncbi:ribbon-helix-helix protein, CopG family [Microbacterium arborescens]